MPKPPGVNHLKAGFRIDRQGEHVFTSKGGVQVVVPRNDPVDVCSMAAIIRDAGLSFEEFKEHL